MGMAVAEVAVEMHRAAARVMHMPVAVVMRAGTGIEGFVEDDQRSGPGNEFEQFVMSLCRCC